MRNYLGLVLTGLLAVSLTGCSYNTVVVPTEPSFTVGGSVSGLNAGMQIVLADNGSDLLTVSANGSFTFPTPVVRFAGYAVSIATQPAGETCAVANGTSAGILGNVSNVVVTCTTNTYTISGMVTGLSGTVVLQNNGANSTTIASNGSFAFSTPVAYGSSYGVTVLTQPTGQTCTVSGGSGTNVTGNVSGVAISCAANTYTIGGTASGLTGTVVLQDNGGDNLSVNSNGNFTFATKVSYAGSYGVTVLTQPAGQTCTVSGGSGTNVTGNVSGVVVSCAANTYTIGGMASGLTGTVVLQDNGGDNLSVNSNGNFTFATKVNYGSSYGVTVLTQPAGQTCTVSGGSGTNVTGNVSGVVVSCAANTYTIGGTASGLTGTVVLQDNGGDNLSVNSNGNFTFATKVNYGSSYGVTVLTQPAGQTCTVSGGSGTNVTGNVSGVVVSCAANTYTIGGTASGLTGTVVLQDNGGDNLSLNSNGSFTFATKVNYGSGYGVTVLTQPTGQTCMVSSGSGTNVTGNVSGVVVTCTTNTYTIGGMVSGLTGTVVLQDNGGDNLSVNSNGSFTFATKVNYAGSYGVTVLTQPTGQTCTVSGGTGTNVTGNVSGVAVSCVANTYTIGGTATGLTGTVVLQDNGGDNLSVNSNGNFTFATKVNYGSNYNVTVLTQPTGQTCTVSSGTGTNVTGNVSGVVVTCATNMYMIGGTLSGLTGTVVLQDSGGDDLTVNSDGTFTFASKVNYGSNYNVTVLTQPTGQTCTVSGGTGTNVMGNVTGVSVSCVADTYTIGGMVTGLSGSVVLQDNGGNNLTVNSDGSFTFSSKVNYGGSYNVTVLTQPTTQTCNVTSGAGTNVTGNVTSVSVNCSVDSYTVGGTVSGLNSSESVTLQDNETNNTTINSNGSFTFSTAIAEGSNYYVTVLTQPVGQTCTVTNGSGPISVANVTNVSVTCASNTTTLSASVSSLALDTAGNARTITITNTGVNSAENLSISLPVWPSGTTSSSTCGNTLNASDSCTITITPGANATSNCNAGTGSAPTPGVVAVSGDNVASSVTTNVSVLTYGCIYQQGYLFEIDDTTPASGSIGGITTSLANNATSISWNNVSFITAGASSLTNGATNTTKIVNAQGPGSYAAITCDSYQIDSAGNSPCSSGNTCYTNWYLPAVCQMGDSSSGGVCSAGTPNMEDNLSGLINGCTGSGCLSGGYWSSTENSTDPLLNAWFIYFSSGGDGININIKDDFYSVRCTRALTP